MNEWKKGLVLFSAMLSPLAMADWQVDVNFEMDRAGKQHRAQTSVSLVPGEETVLFDNGEETGALIGKAELLEVTADEVKISLLVQEQCDDGGWRTIMSPVVSAGLNTPASVNQSNEQLDEFASLKVEITSV
ncbi:hypothetical protein RN22_01930 [Grimontia sp. AD028]|uniref:Uncharacterized protein n=1 Tax=Grimontia indica TaxID=1056512 RepID=R1IY29_9GAMM|nr:MULTISPECIES: hypothetical protein [Grimontia]EOD80245.1 hypothetical protein D515_00817 [Grimontia indica]KKD62100.1 hypothetical protein RN22_01930 [Grimontia sp. AD028]